MEETLHIEKRTLREIRRSFGLTQSELGKMFDLSQVHISFVEQGKLTLLPHQRAAVESLLGPIDWDVRYVQLRRSRTTAQ